MEPWASSLEEPADGRVGTERLQKLHGAGERGSDALRHELFGRGTRLPGDELKKTTGLLEGGHGHGDVVERKRYIHDRGVGVEVFGISVGA
jgi:hypothetical protein